jgi:hypothetical protein
VDDMCCAVTGGGTGKRTGRDIRCCHSESDAGTYKTLGVWAERLTDRL